MPSALKSYLKTTGACLTIVPLTLGVAALALHWLPPIAGSCVAALSLGGTFIAGGLACACLLVLYRYRRDTRGEPDLFLEANRSRRPAAIKSASPPGRCYVRRFLARRILGHDFIVGDLVEVKAWPEIRATLDERGCLDQLPFMPEMLHMCGQRARVFRCMHRLFDWRKSGKMRHMEGAVLLAGTACDGSSHGGCDAWCHTIWKSAWLRRVEPGQKPGSVPTSSDRSGPMRDTAILEFGTQPPRYICQLTQLHAASRPVGKWSAVNALRPLICGNVTLAAFIIGRLTALFNDLQQLRGGIGYRDFGEALHHEPGEAETALAPGDWVIVRPAAEIRATLNDRLIHRGLGFDPESLRFCGGRYRVQSEVKKVIDIVSGEMRAMKTPSYILENVHFEGERQLFNAQYEPEFWRAAWLKRDGRCARGLSGEVAPRGDRSTDDRGHR